MADSIYNFFDFLEKKAGKTLPSDRKALMIIQHARELADSDVLENLSIQDRIIYAPDTLKGSPPIKAKNLDLRNLTELPPYIKIKEVTGHLNLDGLQEIPKGFNPTVGGLLSLNSVKTIPKGFNPTVGGLHMRIATNIPDSFNPTVEGTLFLPNYKFQYKTKKDLRNRFPNAKGVIDVRKH